MKFAIKKNTYSPLLDEITNELIPAFGTKGHELSPTIDGVQFVLNLTEVESPVAFMRRSQSVFVFSFVVVEHPEENLKSLCYTALVQSLSNLLLCVVPNGKTFSIYFTTPEAGFYQIPFNPEQVCLRLLPMAGAHFATKNLMTTDLPCRYHTTSPTVEQIKHYGKELDEMGVLPTPFPLQEILSEKALRHLYRIYGITGASYGNLSAREDINDLGPTTFWMTGRGIDKSNIQTVGEDVLLVKGFDMQSGTALVSVPPGYNPKARVSVDAVEHSMIYSEFPTVGAIVHAHAWMDGVSCTRQNYPCGTRELAEEVVTLLRRTDDPSRTAVGLKNHGLTITGHNLEDIFQHIRGKLRTQVPMFA